MSLPSESERQEKLRFKKDFDAPAMTRMLAQIGADLVQEIAYDDIVHARNLPTMPKDMEGYKKATEQLNPARHLLAEKNAPYKNKIYECQVCSFKTDTLVTFTKHQWTLHYDGKKYSCTMCPEYFHEEERMREHFTTVHEVVPSPVEEPSPHLDCPVCDESFKLKGDLAAHFKVCRRLALAQTRIFLPKEEDELVINQRIWPKPAMESNIPPSKPKPPSPKRTKVALPPSPRFVNLPGFNPFLPPRPPLRNVSQYIPSATNLNVNPAVRQNIQLDQSRHYQQLVGQLLATGNNPATGATQLPTMLKPGAVTYHAPALIQAHKKALMLPQNVATSPPPVNKLTCEICDAVFDLMSTFLHHMQLTHKKLEEKTIDDMQQIPTLACNKCKDRFWCYDGLERHLLMTHGLVTQEFLRKAKNKEDGGRCQICKKTYAFALCQHLIQVHQKSLCRAEITYSCDMCQYSCEVYQELEAHFAAEHPKKTSST